MEKRTKIILSVAVLLVLVLVIAISSGVLSSRSDTIKLEVWPHADDNSASPLIKYRGNDDSSWMTWSTHLNDFLKEYKTGYQQSVPKYAEQLVYCSYINKPVGDKICNIDLRDYSSCTLNDSFQPYSPCLFFRLNKIPNWKPVPYNNTDGLPENMPKDLQEYIGNIHNMPESNNVWMSCDGEDPADKEFIGPVEYIPRRGFPTFYFPYTKNEGYLSPMVAVRFQRPTTGVLIKIVCTAWAKNIKNDENEQQGTIHFSLQID